MPGPTEKKLTLRLGIEADAGPASKAMADLADKLDKVEKGAGKARSALGLTGPGGRAPLATGGGSTTATTADPQAMALHRILDKLVTSIDKLHTRMGEATASGHTAVHSAEGGSAAHHAAADAKKKADAAKVKTEGKNHAKSIGSALVSEFGVGTLGSFATGSATGYAAAAYVAHKAIESTFAYAKAAQDETLPADNRYRPVLKTLPLGETLLGYADTITGRSRGLARANERNQVEQVRTQGASDIFNRRLSIAAGADTYFGRAAALEKASPVLLPNVDRSTAAGEEEFQRQVKLMGARQAISESETRATAATVERERSEKRIVEYDAREADLAERARKASEEYNSLSTRNLRKEAVDKYNNLSARDIGKENATLNRYIDPIDVVRTRLIDEQSHIAEQRQNTSQGRAEAMLAAAQKRVDELMARGEAQKARTGLLDVQSQIASEKASTATSTASRIITGGPQAARMAIQAHDYIERVGIENATPELIAQASSLFGKKIASLAKTAGANSPLYAEIAERSPEDAPAGGPARYESEAVSKQNESTILKLEIERKVAAETTAAWGPLTDAIVKGIQRGIEVAVRDIENKIIRLKIGS